MKVDMEGRRPYRKMAATCNTRPIRERRITWVKLESKPLLEGQFQVQTLRRDLVCSAADLWQAAYPEVFGSPHEFLLDASRYEPLVAIDETWAADSANKVYCMPVLVELKTNKVVAAALLTKFESNLQVEFSFVATHPDYRRRDLTDELRLINRTIALKSGAEYFTTFCETWHSITQNWCISGGWKIAGIFPGNFTRWNGGDEEYRACEIHFYRFVGDGEDFATKPEEWHLAPEVREVWEAVDRVNQQIERRHREKQRPTS